MDIRFLKGVGEKRAKLLQKLGIFTAQDLVSHYPRDYVDFTKPYPVAFAPQDVKCAVKVTVHGKNSVRISGGKQVHKAVCADETGELVVNFFNNPYALQKLDVGKEYFFFGKVNVNYAVRDMTNPTILNIQTAQKTPLLAVYPQTEGVTSAYISKCIKAYFALLYEKGEQIEEPLPQYMLDEYKLLSKAQAVHYIHFPTSLQQVEAARRRLIFEELLCLQLGLFLMKNRNKQSLLTSAKIKSTDISLFLKALPFAPTNAQKRTLDEILNDMNKLTPMNRLLQGDVGSGKTLVAAGAMFVAAQNGYQSALMAPTEILAKQHAVTLEKLFCGLNINIALLTGSIKGKQRKEVLSKIESGEVQVVVGTHAVISDGVTFKNLGLAITDEQHRFGVRQRAKLAAKAVHPHLLVMSATPIPRTLGLLMFGDLDISIIDELPPGRTPIKTYAVTGKKRADLYGFINEQIKNGGAAYIICPLIEDGVQDMSAVTTYYEETASPLLAGYNVGIMHGKLKPDEKNNVMEKFANGELDALVSTTVIEVGVDVPRANIIVIENAERYGLSALHQLRGRVGRGGGAAHCVLVSDHTGEKVRERLSFLCKTTDGFKVAQYDLDTRGPGDFFGSRQHGLPTLRIANLAADTKALYAAQKQAQNLHKSDPLLEKEEHKNLKESIISLFRNDVALN